MTRHTLYLVGGAPRVGKSTLAQRLLRDEGIAWLPTDVLRTVLRHVLGTQNDYPVGYSKILLTKGL